jgi:hypothetical protein
MRPQNNQARPTVLRELSLLRALGASLRTSSHRPDALRRSPPLKRLPQPDDTFAVLTRHGERAALAVEERP